MLEIQGKYNTARVYTDNIDNAAYSQILNMMCQCWARDVNVAIMPESYKMVLARSPKKQMNDIQWYFLTSDKKQLHLHDLKCEYYISRIKKWLWCYPEDIEKVE